MRLGLIRKTHEMNKLQINIEPPSEGWLRIRIAGPNGEARLCASYTPRDTFSELVHAVGTLYRYGDDQTVLVNEEPEQVELKLLKRGDKLVIEVVRRGATTMRNECGFNSGCRQFALRFKRTLEETSYETFADHWRHRPPRHEVLQLWSYFSAQSRSPQSRTSDP